MRRRREKPVEEKCGISGCNDPGERSMSHKKVKDVLGKNITTDEKRVQLCKAHYREFQKATKVERKLEALRR
ncbi:MAG: hypothetical protein KAJ64_05705 [Thermoplasmata archaeon]|nr:hypothetical protein [Thermoplasmata archaeon]